MVARPPTRYIRGIELCFRHIVEVAYNTVSPGHARQRRFENQRLFRPRANVQCEITLLPLQCMCHGHQRRDTYSASDEHRTRRSRMERKQVAWGTDFHDNTGFEQLMGAPRAASAFSLILDRDPVVLKPGRIAAKRILPNQPFAQMQVNVGTRLECRQYCAIGRFEHVRTHVLAGRLDCSNTCRDASMLFGTARETSQAS